MDVPGTEKQLATWLSHQVHAHRQNRLAPARAQALVAIGVDLGDTLFPQWREQADQLVVFVQETKRFLKQSGTPAESKLAFWLKRQRTAAQSTSTGRWNVQRQKYLDRRAPG